MPGSEYPEPGDYEQEDYQDEDEDIDFKEINMKEEETTSCTICGDQTPMMGTKLCDRCWELESRIVANPKLARLILQKIDREELERSMRRNPKISKTILTRLDGEKTDD